MQLRRLHPEPGALEAEQVMRGLGLSALAPPDRPYLVVNMVASVDGRATLEGSSRALSSPVDLELLLGLRTQVDAVLVGTETLRRERYPRLVRRPERRAVRVAEGLAPDPLAVVLTRSGDLPEDIGLFTDPAQEVVVLAEGPAPALRRLRAERGVRSVLCEGGPTLNAALLRDGVVDELFLTLSPVLAGGEDPLTIVQGELGPAGPVALELVSIHLGEGGAYLRFRVVREHG